ncbi:MAG: hypothetical protein COA84_13595 [Robiginitomaculum sp.]|nr:MAG: hypothetical protein COA84_13595 [Robiginitomaculum sp.]
MWLTDKEIKTIHDKWPNPDSHGVPKEVHVSLIPRSTREEAMVEIELFAKAISEGKFTPIYWDKFE